MSSDSKNTTQTENSEICWEMILNGNMRRKGHASEKVACGLNPFWASCFTLLIRSVGQCLESTIRIVYWLCSRTLTEPSTNGWLGFTSELLRGIKAQYIKSGQQKREQFRYINSHLPTGFPLCAPSKRTWVKFYQALHRQSVTAELSQLSCFSQCHFIGKCLSATSDFVILCYAPTSLSFCLV